MGRAVPYKGFDDLLDALAILKAGGVVTPHAVIAAVTDTPEPTPYQRHLASEIIARRLDATLVTRFNPQLLGLLKHPALTAVVVPSRAEPFGRIPLEAFAAGAAPVVATTAGGLAELVTDGQTGYTARPHDPASLATALRKALACSPAERARMRAAAHLVAATCYNHARFLAETAPCALIPSERGQTYRSGSDSAARPPNQDPAGQPQST
ncbi:MAG TPA: glycosyltransferase [Streptosporangiaceae bacterium]|nr:glycosyltransferase [Streptosporangiaceae bacterium]